MSSWSSVFVLLYLQGLVGAIASHVVTAQHLQTTTNITAPSDSFQETFAWAAVRPESKVHCKLHQCILSLRQSCDMLHPCCLESVPAPQTLCMRACRENHEENGGRYEADDVVCLCSHGNHSSVTEPEQPHHCAATVDYREN